MNSLYKNNKSLFALLLGILLHNSLYPITYNNELLSNIIQPGEGLLVVFPENSYVVLEMKNDNFNIKNGCFTYEQLVIDDLRECFERVHSHSVRYSLLGTFSKVIDYKNMYLKEEDIDFKAPILLDLINCLLEASYISLTGIRMNFRDCFLTNSQFLDFHIDSVLSKYRRIQIQFYNQSQHPTLIDGSIDFLRSNIEKALYLTNVKEIRIEFNPRIWND